MATAPGSDKNQLVLLELRRLLPSLHPKETILAKFILDHPVEVRDMKITELADRVQVSQGLIVHFCQRIGLSGFIELKRVLSEAGTFWPDEEVTAAHNPIEVFQKTFEQSIQAMNDTLQAADIASVQSAAEMIRDAAGVELYGVGGSGAIALDSYHKFLRIGFPCAVHTEANLQLMSASLLTPSHVAIGISHSGRTNSVVDSLRLAKERGAATIAITNFKQAPIQQYADVCLYSAARGDALNSENATARLAQLAILDSLYLYVALQRKDGIANLQRTIEAVRHTRY